MPSWSVIQLDAEGNILRVHYKSKWVFFSEHSVVIDKISGAIIPGLRLQRKIDDTAEQLTDNLTVKENEKFKLNKNAV